MEPDVPSPALIDAVTSAVLARIVGGLEANTAEKAEDHVDLFSMGLADRLRRVRDHLDTGG